MKTMVKKDDGSKTVIRVSDEDAKKHLSLGYKFCPKSVWKKLAREHNLDSGFTKITIKDEKKLLESK